MKFVTTEQRRKNMQAIRSTGSKIESLLAKAIFAKGHRYRKNDKTVFGRPDLTFKRLKIAVFIDSEFWHGKDWTPDDKRFKTNASYWRQKITRNIERDKEVNKALKKAGWIVLRFWGKQVLNKLQWCVEKVENAIEQRKVQHYCN